MADIDLAYGHRKATTLAGLKSVLQPGEIGLVTADNSIVMKDYTGAYLNLKAGGEIILFTGDDIAAVVAAIGGASASIKIAGALTLAAHLTTPSNISIIPLKGAMFSGAYTLTINNLGSSPNFQWIGSDVVVKFGSGAVKTTFPQWWGGSINVVDNTTAIQSAIDSFAGIAGETYLTDGIWTCTGQLILPSTDFLLSGAGSDKTRVKYTGTVFQDFLTIGNETDQTVNVRLKDICFLGGEYLLGKARYVVYAHWFNSGCQMDNVQIREGVGLLKISEAFLSSFRNLSLVSSTPDRSAVSASVSHAQWLEVHDTNCAPVMIMRANATSINTLTMYRVGAEIDGGITPYANIIITGQAAGMSNISQESSGTYTADAVTYDLRAKYGTVLGNTNDGNGFVGQIDGHYHEDCDYTLAAIYVEERTHANICSPFWYKVRCDGDLFYNAGAGDINVRDGLIYGGASYSLYHTLQSSGSLSKGADVNFYNVSVLSGLRVTDGGLAGGSFNVFDTGSTSYLLGIADRDGRPTNLDQRYSPKKEDGYAVTQGSDGTGAYILITSGWLMREDGTYVSNRHSTNEGLPVYQKIRPTTASKYYRVFVGKAGQPYLVQYDAAQTDPTGNWIAEFATNGATAITGLIDNARVISYTGNYLLGSQYMTSGTALPTTGYWNDGDVFWWNPSSNSTPQFYRVTTPGLGGAAVWTACDDFATKSLTAINATLSGTIIFTSASIGANRILKTDGSKNIITTSVLADDGTTTTIRALTVTATDAVSTGSIKSTGATAGIGYATGAGGTVTQATNKSTAVTLSKVSGQITMHNAALASGAVVSFTWTNTAIEATDGLILHNQSGGTPGAYMFDYQCAAGSAVITVRNLTAGSLSEAIVIGFQLVKGVIA